MTQEHKSGIRVLLDKEVQNFQSIVGLNIDVKIILISLDLGISMTSEIETSNSRKLCYLFRQNGK